MIEIDTKVLSDAEILVLSLERPNVFSEIVSRYQRQFLRKASSILRNEDDAYDVVQDTFVRIYTSARRFKKRDGASFSSWAYTILTNQCYTHYRRRARHASLSLESSVQFYDTIPDEAGLEELERKFTSDYILNLISKLPVTLSRAVKLYFIDGLPQKVIAKQEGVSEGVIRTRVHRAKKELQNLNLKFAYAGVRPTSASPIQTTR